MQYLEPILTCGGFGLTLFLVRRWIVGLDAKVDSIMCQHNECQRELPEKYATRQDAVRLWERSDKLAEDLSYYRGRFNGHSERD